MLSLNKETKIGILGMGYVGLPLACLFAEKYTTVGYDINQVKIARLISGGNEAEESADCHVRDALAKGLLTLTADVSLLEDCDVYIVAVPTPVSKSNEPNIGFVLNATRTVGELLGRDNVVIYESTVYPGLTEDVCVPLLEQVSGLEYNKDFYVGFSPERINPGDKCHTVDKILKVTSGSTPEAADMIDRLYGSVLENGTFKAKSIKVAEACKIMENCERDVLIAFFNECRMIFDKMGIDIRDVTAAAATKWNFVTARPGLVGGHCIAVDPYYLISKAHEIGSDSVLLSSARQVNEETPHWMARDIDKAIVGSGVQPSTAKVLVLGFAFKPDCADIRNSKVGVLVNDLNRKGYHLTVYDPFVDTEAVLRDYGVRVTADPAVLSSSYQAVVIGTAHSVFKKMDKRKFLKGHGFVCDIYGVQEVKQ